MDMRRTSLTLVLLMVFSTTLSMIETTDFSPLVDENSDTSARNGATAWLQDRADTLGNAGSHSSIEQAPDTEETPDAQTLNKHQTLSKHQKLNKHQI